MLDKLKTFGLNADSELIIDVFHFKKKIKKRAEWTGSLDFFLAALGYASKKKK